jgi:translation initiation factor IF-3
VLPLSLPGQLRLPGQRRNTPLRRGGRLITTREPRVNEKIRAREVRLVSPDGGQIGIKSIDEARWLADQLGLDLVEVAPEARPPVVRMMDYGKFKYDQSVKARETRKKQTRTVIKEVQFRPKIGDSDFEVKRKRVERFLGEGDKVKITMRFRGREVTHPELGRVVLERLVSSVGETGVVETMPRMDGRQMTMVLVPGKKAMRKDLARDAASHEVADEVEEDAELMVNAQLVDNEVLDDAAESDAAELDAAKADAADDPAASEDDG